MKINIILPALGDSGGIRVVEKYVNIFRKNGEDVVIYGAIKNNNLNRYDSKFKNIVHQYFCSCKTLYSILKGEKKSYKFVWKISNKRIRQADVTIATMWATAYDLQQLDCKVGKKIYFIQGYEVWDNKILGEQSYSLNLEKIVVSSWINLKLKENLKLGPFPIIYNGIEEKYICDKNFEKNNDKLVCLMMNHTLETKGVKMGIEAFNLAQSKNKNIELIMFGMCSSDNLSKEIDYYYNPSIDTLLELYKKADVFLFPSSEEGWGLAPIEAMANKCVVIGTNTGFVLDLGRNYENMIIVSQNNSFEMAEKILEISQNKELQYKISENGYKTACSLDWNKSAEKFLEILKNRNGDIL